MASPEQPSGAGQLPASASERSGLRATLLGHRPAVLWLTGLSGAGKTTLATALEEILLRSGVLATVLDGDQLRAGLSRDLGFSADDRSENIRRTGEAATLIAAAGAVAIVALISPFRADRQRVADLVRARGIPFAEVFVNADLAVCERRDPKALYRRARAGEIRDLTGIGSPYEAPLNPQLELHTGIETVAESTRRLTHFALALVRPNGQASSSLRSDT
ncbi:MAG: adenylyl-sulfate kinase [Opitutaceae bacterium]|nr:adenylyl-sulfate kinase [Opitutaceae bacterium]